MNYLLQRDATKGINEKNYEIYEKYICSCSIKSKETVNTTYKIYSSNMNLFFKYLKTYEGNRYIISDKTIKLFPEIWERYASLCISNGNNNKTINNKRTAISSFLDWCEKRDYIKYNPFRKIESLKITNLDRRRESYFLTQKQIWEINFEMKRNTKLFNIQDRLIFNLFLDSAARISAIHSLKLSQLNLTNYCFENVREKEGYLVSIIFFEDTKKILEEWIEERKINGIDSEWLLISNYNKKYNQVSKETIRNRIKKIGKIVGINNFYPHSIRKTIINIISEIGNINDGASLANHKDIKVTSEHYIKEKNHIAIRNRLIDLRNKAGL